MNQGEGKTALGEDEIGQPDSNQASNIVRSSAEGCPRGNRMSIQHPCSHRLPGLIHFWTRLSSCACAATGHAAAPPTGVVNSRRFIQAVLR